MRTHFYRFSRVPLSTTQGRRGFTFLEMVTVLIMVAVVAAFLWPMLMNDRHGREGGRSKCQMNLKQIMLGVKQYLQDNNERFPIVKTSGTAFGWADALHPYLKTTEIFQCPDESTEPQSQSDPTQLQYTDYWYNARMSGAKEEAFEYISNTICFGDGNDGTDITNARYHLKSIPAQWRKNPLSPAYRRLGGANFAFADGHVKWLKPGVAQESRLDSNTFSFLVAEPMPPKPPHPKQLKPKQLNPRLRPTH